MIIPSINSPNLYNGAGTNPYPYYPNLYWYETDYTSQTNDPPTNTAPNCAYVAPGEITNYTVDTGAVSFFQTIFNNEYPSGNYSTAPLGGYIQWINGTLSESSTS
jgi:hypothetical protein